MHISDRKRGEINNMCEYCNKKINNKKLKDIDNDKEDFGQVVFLRNKLLSNVSDEN